MLTKKRRDELRARAVYWRALALRACQPRPHHHSAQFGPRGAIIDVLDALDEMEAELSARDRNDVWRRKSHQAHDQLRAARAERNEMEVERDEARQVARELLAILWEPDEHTHTERRERLDRVVRAWGAAGFEESESPINPGVRRTAP